MLREKGIEVEAREENDWNSEKDTGMILNIENEIDIIIK